MQIPRCNDSAFGRIMFLDFPVRAYAYTAKGTPLFKLVTGGLLPSEDADCFSPRYPSCRCTLSCRGTKLVELRGVEPLSSSTFRSSTTSLVKLYHALLST